MSQGVTIDLKIDSTDFRRRARRLRAEEIPKAIDFALLETARRVKDAEEQEALRAFSKSESPARARFIAKGFVARGLSKTPANTAEVYARPKANKILKDHVEGARYGSARIRSGKVAARLKLKQWVATPARGVQRGKSGKVRLSSLATKQERANRHFIIPLGGSDALFLVRTTKRKARKDSRSKYTSSKSAPVALFFLTKSAKVDESIDFYGLARRVGRREIRAELDKSIRKTVRRR